MCDETPDSRYIQFRVGVEMQKRHYYKDLGSRMHTVEEAYLVEV